MTTPKSFQELQKYGSQGMKRFPEVAIDLDELQKSSEQLTMQTGAIKLKSSNMLDYGIPSNVDIQNFFNDLNIKGPTNTGNIRYDMPDYGIPSNQTGDIMYDMPSYGIPSNQTGDIMYDMPSYGIPSNQTGDIMYDMPSYGIPSNVEDFLKKLVEENKSKDLYNLKIENRNLEEKIKILEEKIKNLEKSVEKSVEIPIEKIILKRRRFFFTED